MLRRDGGLIPTNHSSLNFDQSQLSLFRPITMRNKQQIAMTHHNKRHFRSGCRNGNMHHSSLHFLPPKYYEINKNISTNMYGGTMPQKVHFSKFRFSKFWNFQKFGPHFLGLWGYFPFFKNSFGGMGLNYNTSPTFRPPFLLPSSGWYKRFNYWVQSPWLT